MSEDWKTYRTRFVVRAKQLTQPSTLTDINGREQHGQAGDYLIESSEGLRIARREVFEDVYVAMEATESVPHSIGHCEENPRPDKHNFSLANADRQGKIGPLVPVQTAPEQVILGTQIGGTW